MIYGDDADQNLLEKAVRWVIIVIVLVFDPLAVILLLASQYSFSWFRQEQEQSPQEEKQIEEEPIPSDEMPSDVYEMENFKDETKQEVSDYKYSLWPFPSHIGKKDEDTLPVAEEKHQESIEELKPVEENKDPIENWNEMIAEAEKAVEAEKEKEDHEIIESAADNEKEAMAAWKHDNPDSSLKLQRRLFANGAIDKLPWEDYLKPKADFGDDEAAAEAAKWAQEQLEKKNEISWMEHDEQGNQVVKTKDSYQQNAEQNERTIWQRIQDAKK